jgi:hypothetical protein
MVQTEEIFERLRYIEWKGLGIVLKVREELSGCCWRALKKVVIINGVVRCLASPCNSPCIAMLSCLYQTILCLDVDSQIFVDPD